MVLPYKLLVATYAMALRMLTTAPVDFKPLDVISGSDTQIEQARVMLVGDSAKWRQLWNDHKGARNLSSGGASPPIVQVVETAPRLDFKDVMVIAIFAGQTSGVAGYQVVDADGKGSEAILRLRPVRSPSTGTGIVTTPYALVLVPRIKKPISVYLDAGTRRPVWKLMASFAAPKE